MDKYRRRAPEYFKSPVPADKSILCSDHIVLTAEKGLSACRRHLRKKTAQLSAASEIVLSLTLL